MSALEVSLRFSGGSTMQAKVMESNSPPLKNGAKISGIFEQSAALRILCEDESQLSLTLGNPGSSVTVRDATGAVEYLG
jgi:hypothetical protein